MGVEKALEFKKRQSEMRKGRVVSEETKKKISDYHKNKKKEVKELINKNIKVSEIVKITGIPFQTIYKWKKGF